MGQASPEADIFLERDSTRVRGTLDIVTQSNPGSPAVQLNPMAADVTVSPAERGQRPRIEVRSGEDTVLGELRAVSLAEGSRGELNLGSTSGSESIRVRSHAVSGFLHILEEDTVRTRLETELGPEFPIGGRITVHQSDGTDAVVLRTERARNPELVSGVVEVHDRDGVATGRLLGADAALELFDSVEGGGDLLVVGAAPQGVEAPPDVFVNFNDGGAAAPGDDARISLAGSTGTVELGRPELGPNRPGVAGRLNLRSGTGGQSEIFLEAGVDAVGDDRFGELLLRRIGQSGLETAGRIAANGDGVLLSSGPGGTQPVTAAAQITDRGELQLAGQIDTALAAATPAFAPSISEAQQGDTGEVELTVGDTTTLEFKMGEATMNYELTATLSGYTDARLWLGIDTSGPTSSDPTLTVVAGDASIVSVTENAASVSGALDPGDYPLKIRPGGTSSWSDVATFTVTR